MHWGAVIRGQTGHYDLVCQGATSGIAAINQCGKVPVTYGLLATDTVEQALNRAGIKAGNKGHEAAQALVELLSVSQQVAELI